MKPIAVWLLMGLVLTAVPAAGSDPAADAHPAAVIDLQKLIARMEEHYAAAGFSARFFQESTLKAMEITDTATGRIFIERPGKMRWEYEAPEPQVIISDGSQLWIYKPEDNQVMVGKAPTFFGDGKGAGFLADIGQLRDRFDISPVGRDTAGTPVIRLVPVNPSPETDLSEIRLMVDEATGEIRQIVTLNAYGDVTRIALQDTTLAPDLDDGLFRFEVPEGVEILQMEP